MLQLRSESRNTGWYPVSKIGRLHSKAHLRSSKTIPIRLGGTSALVRLTMEEDLKAPYEFHGHADTPTYKSWAAMHRRCADKSYSGYRHYGGKGVTVCARWAHFEFFLIDMGERPAGKTLDRFPNRSGNYELSNCRWATRFEQARNRSDTTIFTVDGYSGILTDLCQLYGVKFDTVYRRIKLGWDVERALFAPVQVRRFR